jgi:hypothetical protein
MLHNNTSIYKLGASTFPQMSWYKYEININTILLVPAAFLIDKEDTAITQVDSYTPNISSYTRTTNTTGTKTGGGKVAPRLQFKYRIMLVVKNPLQIQETRRYGTTQ